MGRLQKKGTTGVAAQYISRTKAVRKLQISLKDFRRLCILKGVFPRDPKKKPGNNSSQTFYHKKDILFLANEPLLGKFRQFKTFLKKYNKAKGRKEESKAASLLEQAPKLSLDHLIRERYPSFMDAIRDLDDPLTMIHLFASLPSGATGQHTAERAQQCLRLAREFQTLVIQDKTCEVASLEKTFVSVKGIYFQVKLKGELVTWVVPHKFAQQLPADVDFKVMLTFLEFYETLMRFVNFKLYHDIGFLYPPRINVDLDSKGLGLDVVETEALNEAEPESNEFAAVDPATAASNRIFTGLVFYLSRETPQEALEFTILALGGRVVLDNPENPALYDSAAITHVVMDRNAVHREAPHSREHIQPQWVFDCCNVKALLPIRPYAPGVVPPAHLSPFVDDAAAGYVPKQREVIDQWLQRGEAQQAVPVAVEQATVSREEEYAEGLEQEQRGVFYSESAAPETSGQEEDTTKEYAKIMMTKKNKRLYSRMQHGIQQKKEKTEQLMAKRKEIEEKQQ